MNPTDTETPAASVPPSDTAGPSVDTEAALAGLRALSGTPA